MKWFISFLGLCLYWFNSLDLQDWAEVPADAFLSALDEDFGDDDFILASIEGAGDTEVVTTDSTRERTTNKARRGRPALMKSLIEKRNAANIRERNRMQTLVRWTSHILSDSCHFLISQEPITGWEIGFQTTRK